MPDESIIVKGVLTMAGADHSAKWERWIFQYAKRSGSVETPVFTPAIFKAPFSFGGFSQLGDERPTPAAVAPGLTAGGYLHVVPYL